MDIVKHTNFTINDKDSYRIINNLYKKQDINTNLYITELTKIIDTFTVSCDVYTYENKWKKCSDNCFSLVSTYINKEITSTIYILKAIADSIITVENNLKHKPLISFGIKNGTTLTGLWKDDIDKIKITNIRGNSNNIRRLIMGFGPSASGKTYWAKNIIELFSKANKTFPKTFISIDGGLYRESSTIYKLTRDAIHKCFSGFSNLVSTSLFQYSLFNSTLIKKVITNFLEQQDLDINISLYVPETLGDCGNILGSCESKYKKYIDITNDKQWIGLLIWQHKTKKECNYHDMYKCSGCTESGTQREEKEGKKYSSARWKASMKNGIAECEKAPGGYFHIHNSGDKKRITVIEDFSSGPSQVSYKNIEKYNVIFIRK